jgi:hypothetical protein
MSLSATVRQTGVRRAGARAGASGEWMAISTHSTAAVGNKSAATNATQLLHSDRLHSLGSNLGREWDVRPGPCRRRAMSPPSVSASA